MTTAARSSSFPDWPYLPPRMDQRDLDAYLLHAARRKATDVHFQSLRPVAVKQFNRLYSVTDRRLELSEVQALAAAVLGAHIPATLGRGEDADGDYSIVADEDRFRFRVNARGVQVDGQNGAHLVFRIIPSLPPSLDDLKLPAALQKVLLSVRRGLIVVAGPAGSGKSTTIAAALRHILEDPDRHEVVLTVESPIEFLFDRVKLQNSIVAQSQIGLNIPSWTRALRGDLRRGPTIIFIGESRDADTMAATLDACLTGHLTLTTLHSTGVPATVSRMVRMFPKGSRDTAFADLVEAMQLIMSQRLLPATDGGLVAVHEWLAPDVNLKNALLDVRPDKTTNALRSNVHTAGTSFKLSADELLRAGRITPAVHEEFLRSYAI